MGSRIVVVWRRRRRRRCRGRFVLNRLVHGAHVDAQRFG
jgi:hypothetical protein